MRATGNTIKHGRVWFHPWRRLGKIGNREKNYDKSIGVEWSLRFNPLNFCLTLDGNEGRYMFSFWFIWVFYISIEGFRNWYYPKEWNSCTNNGKGGYLKSGERKIGITQYDWGLHLYLWHDGEHSWYPDKCDKIWDKYVLLDELIIGPRKYHTINEYDKELYLELPEKTYKINIHCRFWHRKSKRWLFRFLNHKGKAYQVLSENIPFQEFKGGYDKDDNGERMIESRFFHFKENDTDGDLLKQYKDFVLEKREKFGGKNWVPEKYRKIFERKEKLKRVLN